MADTPADLDHWVDALASALGLPESEVPLIGLAVARGMTMEDAAAHARTAIEAWRPRT